MTRQLIKGLSVAAAFLASATASLSAQDLSYQWEAGQKFSYDVEVVVDSEDETITYKGVIHYVVGNVNAEQATVTYRGGLAESKAAKQRSAGRVGPRGFGPGGFRPPSIPSPFSRPAFAGKTQTTNKLVIDRRGHVVAMEGDSQLPYLLGNVSIMPFETLPDGNPRQWKSDDGVSITEEGDDRRGPFGRFGPMSPFGNNEPKSVQAGSEVSTYSIQQTKGNLVTIKKDYRLNSPATAESEGFEMVGTGTWSFDQAEHVPQAYRMQISLKVQSANTVTTIPIKIQYDRLSQEKLAEMEAAAKQRADELAKAAAEKKAMSETPLTDQETSEILATLASSNTGAITDALNRLAEKSLTDPDPRIAQAIARHLESRNSSIASAAGKAMAKWSPDYALKKRLEKDYQGPGVLKSTDLYVESTTPLFVGQIVQAQQPRYGSFWRAAKVKRLMPDGQVELAFLTWGKERDVSVVGRRNIQLAPPELDQPDQPKGMSGQATAAGSVGTENVRTWTDKTGQFKVEATFLGVEGTTVRLQRSDGRSMSIPLDRLSAQDQAHVRQLQQAENPFQLD